MLTKVLVAVFDVPFCAIPEREFPGENISKVGHFSSSSYTNSSHCAVTHQAPPNINIIYYYSILNTQDLVTLVFFWYIFIWYIFFGMYFPAHLFFSPCEF